jgi:DNA replication protein DnaC
MKTQKHDTTLRRGLAELQLTWILDNHEVELAEAARHNRTHHDLLQRLAAGELDARHIRAIKRRIRDSKLRDTRTLESFDFSWPAKINRDQVRHLFTLSFMREKANVVLIGGVGLGKTHIASALAREACSQRLPVLFTSAVDIVNHLDEARQRNNLTVAMRRYTRPQLLCVDELGYLPLDKVGAELLFQVFCARYETGSTVITTNRPYRDWAKTFANDATMASAVLDRVTHHCETIIIEGKSYRMKDRIDSGEE